LKSDTIHHHHDVEQVRLNLFKIEQASVELIKIIPCFSDRNFKLDCLKHSLHRHIYNKLTKQPSFISTSYKLQLSRKLF